MADFIDFLKFLGCGVLLVATIVGGGAGVSFLVDNAWQYNACKTYSKTTGFPYSYTWASACLLRTPDGRWVDADAYLKNVQDVKAKVQ